MIRFLREDKGVTAVEYSILLSFVAVLAMVALAELGSVLKAFIYCAATATC